MRIEIMKLEQIGTAAEHAKKGQQGVQNEVPL
jgi:hypothetical protein